MREGKKDSKKKITHQEKESEKEGRFEEEPEEGRRTREADSEEKDY